MCFSAHNSERRVGVALLVFIWRWLEGQLQLSELWYLAWTGQELSPHGPCSRIDYPLTPLGVSER